MPSETQDTSIARLVAGPRVSCVTVTSRYNTGNPSSGPAEKRRREEGKTRVHWTPTSTLESMCAFRAHG